jgi:hypothetical protein
MADALMIVTDQRCAPGGRTGKLTVRWSVSDGQTTSRGGRPPRLLRSVGSCTCHELGFGLLVCSVVRWDWRCGRSRRCDPGCREALGRWKT